MLGQVVEVVSAESIVALAPSRPSFERSWIGGEREVPRLLFSLKLL